MTKDKKSAAKADSKAGKQPETPPEETPPGEQAGAETPPEETPPPEAEALKPEAEALKPEAEAPEPEAEAPEPEAEVPEPEAEAPEPEGEAPEPTPQDRIATLEAEAASQKDQLLRALAEVENTRRRAERDRQEASRYGAAGLARDLLSVADNLRRALESLPEEAREGEAEWLKNFVLGVELTEKELLGAFSKHAIEKIDPLDQPFDHTYHQAMFELADTGKAAGTVVQMLQAGYRLRDRLLRPAMVGVAKGDPVAAEAPEAETEEATEDKDS